MIESNYKRLSEHYLELTENELLRLRDINGSIYPKLSDAMFYSVSAGGKRLRPCLALAVCDMLGGELSAVLPIACAIEMIHTYSLIHDDLPCMDDDDMRRGQPSNHKVFGEAMAVLAGDGLLSLAHETMIKGLLSMKSELREGYIKAMDAVASLSGSSGMVSGQAADIEAEGESKHTAEMLEYIHKHKTADMLCAAILSGAYTAGADETVVEKLRFCGENIGLLFQITDDILDLKGDEKLVGKTLGKDNIEGKLTYTTLYGLNGAEDAARAAAERAKHAVCELPNNGYLIHLIESILVRSY